MKNMGTPDHLLSPKEVLNDYDIKMDSVDICRRFRKFGMRKEPIQLKRDEHEKNPYALQFMSYLDTEIAEQNVRTGKKMTVEDYLKQYISALQPFMIKEKNLKYFNNDISAIIHDIYKHPIYIKIDNGKDKLIVSFHEDYDIKHNFMPSMIRNSDLDPFNNRASNLVVFADSAEPDFPGTDKNSYDISFPFFIGMNLIDIKIDKARKTTDGLYVIPSDELFREVQSVVERYFNDICSFTYFSDWNVGISESAEEVIRKELSEADVWHTDLTFTSYGHTMQSVLSYFIDVMDVCNHATGISKHDRDMIQQMSETVMACYIAGSSLDEEKKKSLTDFLHERYKYHIDKKDDTGTIVNSVFSLLTSIESTDEKTKLLEIVDNAIPENVNDFFSSDDIYFKTDQISDGKRSACTPSWTAFKESLAGLVYDERNIRIKDFMKGISPEKAGEILSDAISLEMCDAEKEDLFERIEESIPELSDLINDLRTRQG